MLGTKENPQAELAGTGVKDKGVGTPSLEDEELYFDVFQAFGGGDGVG